MKIFGKPDEATGQIIHSIARGPFLVASAALLSPYLLEIAKLNANDDGKVIQFGVKMTPANYVVVYSAIAMLLAAISGPFFGAASDFSNHRKLFAQIGTYSGALFAIMAIFLVSSNLQQFGGIVFIFSWFCYEAAITFIYAYLPEIGSDENDRSSISSKATIGSSISEILLMASLTFVLALYHAPVLNIYSGNVDALNSEISYNITSEYFAPIACRSSKPKLTSQSNRLPFCQREASKLHSGKSSLAIYMPIGSKLPIRLEQVHKINPWRDVSVMFSVWVALDSNEKEHNSIFSSSYIVAEYSKLKEQEGKNSGNNISNKVEKIQNEIARSRSVELNKDYSFLKGKGKIEQKIESIHYRLEFTTAEGKNPEIKTPLKFFSDDMDVISEPTFIRPMFFMLTGIWWWVFGQISFNHLQPRKSTAERNGNRGYCFSVFKDLWLTLFHSYQHPQTQKFLIAMMFWHNGTATLLVVLGIYLEDVLEMGGSAIALFFLISCLSGIIGACLSHIIGKKYGQANTILIFFIFWTLLPMLIFLILTKPSRQQASYFFALVAGALLGGNYSLDRAFFAGLIPEGHEGEYMGLLGFFSKCTVWTGTFFFAWVNQKFNSVQYATLLISPFFFFAFVFQLLLVLSHSEPERQNRPKKYAGDDSALMNNDSSEIPMTKLEDTEQLDTEVSSLTASAVLN